ncbi:PepSY domain-containing protein [Microbulbifer yueqingensis]|uniref:Peptidase propeptide and YPEB domain-containing protein n=1 Tax=Microbulbifer yueqingensis TaxID=658219 RepID=A0A1G9DYR7_9GAMM|nr:PepSY domain-containing protein [Microbulbifer yueqingensis]SDK68960.1 Peptidase propeptide and YPEB domain-containing protein [Microbulbifer yueqingensis]
MYPTRNLLMASLLAVLAAPAALADEHKPPPGAMALSMLLTKLEQQGYQPIIEATLVDEHWEIEAYKTGEKRELEVDPNTGEVLSDEAAD